MFHPNKKNIKIVYGDIFRMDFSRLIIKQWNNITIYLYISPWYLEKTIENCKLQIENLCIVSYMYPLTNKTTFAKASAVKGKNSIFIYNL